MKPLILINFKTYSEGTGKSALKLAKIINNFKSNYQFAIAPQLLDLKEIIKTVKIPVFAQHLDPISYGSHTGHVLPEAIKGAKGTILNHSERRISLKEIKATLQICKELNLKTVVCASSLSQVKKLAKLRPDYLAYEPKRLIGKNISVVEVNPKVITKAVKLFDNILVGAGVHSKKDIQTAIKLGAKGVLIAHKVVMAKNTKNILKRMFT